MLSHLSTPEILNIVGIIFLAIGGVITNDKIRKIDNKATILDRKTLDIYSQTQPNHGSSMRDAIDRVKHMIEQNDKKLEDLALLLEHQQKNTEIYRQMLEGRLIALERKTTSKRGK